MIAKSIKVFYCYSHEDKILRDELEKHLSPLRRLKYITGWFDRDILAGTNWTYQIETQLDIASIILLLISPDFFSSDYCYSIEMQRALKRHREGTTHVIPIILRPVHWEETPIGKLQVLPTNGIPVTQWSDRDLAFLDVTRGISTIVKMLLSKEILSQQETGIFEALEQTVQPSMTSTRFMVPNDHSSAKVQRPEAVPPTLQYDSTTQKYSIASSNHPAMLSSGRESSPCQLTQQPPLILSAPLSSMEASAKPMLTPAIDSKEVLDQVRGKNIPATWHVCYPPFSGGWRDALGGAVSALLIIGPCTIANGNLASITLGVLIFIYLISMSVSYSEQVLVLMPNGLVLHARDWPFPWKKTRAVDYGVVEGIRVDSTPFLGFVTLTFERTDAAMNMKLRIDRSFGDVDMTMKAIMNAYNQFMGNRLALSSTGTTLLTYHSHSRAVHDVAWSPDGKRIVSGGADKTVQIWDALSGEQLATYLGHSKMVNAVVWSPDNTRIASVRADGTAKVWDVATGYNTVRYGEHSSAISGISWSLDNTRIATASRDRTIQIWNAASGKRIVKCRVPSRSLVDAIFPEAPWTTVRWSPDSTHLASAICGAAGIQIWTVNGKHIYTYTGHSKDTRAVTWSPDGRRIASASKDGTVHIWDAINGGNVYCYQGHSDWVTGVAWSPDGRRIASASKDGTVHVWMALDGRNVCCYSNHTAWVNTVAWSPDGTYLASASDDRTVHIWKTA